MTRDRARRRPTTLDCIPSDGASHSIGTIRVDPNDGSLWVGVGDSASFNRVDELAFRASGCRGATP